MQYQVDLNSDIGESYGAYTIGQDDEVMEFITSANIACGYHAGDHNIIHRTIDLAIKNNVAIGAHPGLQDLIGFGRRPMQISPEEVYQLTVYQIGAVQAFAQVKGHNLYHVKPHGALYNMAAKDTAIAKAIAQAVYDYNPNLILFGLANSELIRMGKEVGLNVANEVFADRTYQPDGSLTPRTSPNAMIHDTDEAVERVIRMVKENKIEAVDGTDISIIADTICIHGDGPKSLEFSRRLSHELKNQGISIQKREMHHG
ncbi:LamB/YcsF family protein [Oceanobacillus iheyensis]|uniref:5-oxoprolinase subunit A n=1 Tax=Oceanobacillus iheyensis (strain DSM 14371 / CIP 107618 / JCM 11309 / KCTC 3954 / HTE831) TaxID=221109 RepID=PXPA_OCEIH|nr:5-oxoprolinase subunit PxpA [Oceanobacillus iheyensis]Q8EN13.1 RecName: Full=5-oxoprolinase subunit A; Short=5-OPase subunit A; AltName: Full=5-oxoprolinase (ATP-hydrolyzing) subunit A [Oceanobacillus iheyensis HTE831]BAC14633.1 lactam utilization protein [Oceanobacillus iheyensis HTE831]